MTYSRFATIPKHIIREFRFRHVFFTSRRRFDIDLTLPSTLPLGGALSLPLWTVSISLAIWKWLAAAKRNNVTFRVIMLILALLGVLWDPSGVNKAKADCRTRATLYQAKSRGGSSLELCKGNSAHLSLKCINEDWFGNCDPSWNDRISSLEVEKGAALFIYKDADFKGKCIRVGPSNNNIYISDLTRYRFNDVASSYVLICWNCADQGSVPLYWERDIALQTCTSIE